MPPTDAKAWSWARVADAAWERERGQLALWAPVAIGCGVWAFFAAPIEPPRSLALFALGLAAVLGWGSAALGRRIARGGRGGAAALAAARVATMAAALMALGVSTASWRTWSVAAPIWPTRAEASLEGRVIAIAAAPRRGVGREATPQDDLRLTFDQLRLDGVERGVTPARVRLRVRRDGAAADLTLAELLGRRLRVDAVLAPPPGPSEPGAFDFRFRAWFQQLGAVGFATGPPVDVGPAAAEGSDAPAPHVESWARVGLERISLAIARLRADLADRARAAAPGPEGAIMAALLVGDRSGLTDETVEALRASNLAHLLAISGLHMGIVCLTVFGAVRVALAFWPGAAARADPKKLAAIAALLAGIGYLALSGAAVSTQRAFLMAAVAFGAVLVDRPAITLRAVAIAATLILLWRPESVFDAGFQMSFAATTALVAAFEAARTRRRAVRAAGDDAQPLSSWARLSRSATARWGAALVAGAAVAGAATAPFAAFAFNRLTRYGLLANVAAAPAMGIWIMPFGLAALALTPFGLEAWAFEAMGLGVRYVLTIGETVAAWPGATWPAPAGPPAALIAMAAGGLWLCLWRGALLRALGLVGLCLGLAGWATTPRPDVLISSGGGLIGVQTPAGRALDRETAHSFAAALWLRRDGDPADQAEAYGRPAFARFSGGKVARTKEGWRIELALDRRISPDRWDRLCQPGAIVIAPRATAPETRAGSDPPQCLAFDRGRLAASGAIAIWVRGAPGSLDALDLQTSAERERLWSPRRPGS